MVEFKILIRQASDMKDLEKELSSIDLKDCPLLTVMYEKIKLLSHTDNVQWSIDNSRNYQIIIEKP